MWVGKTDFPLVLPKRLYVEYSLFDEGITIQRALDSLSQGFTLLKFRYEPNPSFVRSIRNKFSKIPVFTRDEIIKKKEIFIMDRVPPELASNPYITESLDVKSVTARWYNVH